MNCALEQIPSNSAGSIFGLIAFHFWIGSKNFEGSFWSGLGVTMKISSISRSCVMTFWGLMLHVLGDAGTEVCLLIESTY